MTLVLLALLAAQAPQEGPYDERVMAAVRAAVLPALPYPESDEDGSLPKDGKTTEAWMVRPHFRVLGQEKLLFRPTFFKK